MFAGYEGAGWGGGALTFLVLLPLHVATLHRCLVVLLRCMHEGVGWGERGKLVATLEQSMPNGVPSKTSSLTDCVQRAEIFSSL